jgi:hypothetical protein
MAHAAGSVARRTGNDGFIITGGARLVFDVPGLIIDQETQGTEHRPAMAFRSPVNIRPTGTFS